MDDSFQFIIESPQHNQGHKKRPRLVTSCDNCRLKKIKCLQPSPETKCEACKTSKIPCRFRDRERYFAERSRAIAGPSAAASGYGDEQRTEANPALDAFSVASGSSSPSTNPRSNSHSPKASGLVSAEGESNGRYQSYPPDPRRPTDPSHRHAGPSSVYSSRGHEPAGYGYSTPPPPLPQSHSSRGPVYQPNSRHVHLFDPEQPQCPHPMLMPHYIQTFFERFGGEYTFLTYEETIAEFWDRTLPPMLANCIAAMASRFSNLPELTVRGLHNVAETYADNAKTILASMAHIPTMDTLHALMLLSWSEYKNNRVTNFRTYCQMAMRMAMDLGLSDQNALQGHFSEKERSRRRATWANILQLHLSASSYDR
ncbi:hypothetical protein Hypma_008003 [Hypsizygus marmoreus]|uniref:Zn(2)-C6 fungal-type domain-containing protein n=1 Tax=Hypsizygus marmoreus TaxID=39966 RepID=A0A369JYV2_HYPMA|nr:hypothetical protein Hypma_008003 [Hypsizygus marmoreus]